MGLSRGLAFLTIFQLYFPLTRRGRRGRYLAAQPQSEQADFWSRAAEQFAMEIIATQSADNGSVVAAPSASIRPVDRPEVQSRKGKSRVTNGKSYFVEHDGRGPWTRRWRDLYDQIIADLSALNPAGLTEGQRQLARRAATICIQCEKMEGQAAAGEDIDFVLYGMLTDRLGRTFDRLGLKRRAEERGQFGRIIRTGYERQQRAAVARQHGAAS